MSSGPRRESQPGTSDPHATRAPFRPGLKELVAHKTRLYGLMHRLHFVRMHEVRELSRCLLAGQDLVDIACGDGFFTRRFGDTLGCRVWGVDLMEARIARARFYNAGPNCSFVLADATALPFEDEHFGQAVSVGSLEHFDEPDRALREAYRVLKPGGRLALTCDAFWNAGFSEDELAAHSARYYVQQYFVPEALRELLVGAGFEVLRIEPLFRSAPAIRLFRGAMRLGVDWSNPIYNVYSAMADPVVRVAERLARDVSDRGIYLLAECVRPERVGQWDDRCDRQR